MRDDQTTLLIQAVSKLTVAVEKLDGLLRDEYPKRSEVERKFVSKGDRNKTIHWLVIGALITVMTCYGLTVGIYSKCFVGLDNPSVCNAVPGYDDRINRMDKINERIAELENRTAQLEQSQTKK